MNSSGQTREDISKNMHICKLFRTHIKEFFVNISIPYKYFEQADFDISKVMYENEDVLYYNKKYLSDEQAIDFYQVFNRYVKHIVSMFNEKSVLYKHLAKLNNAKDTSFLKTTINGEYEIISPLYIAKIFNKNCVKYKGEIEKIEYFTNQHLDYIMEQARIAIKKFKSKYKYILKTYVLGYPGTSPNVEEHVKQFIARLNNIVYEFAKILIDIKIYAIQPIINNIIDSSILESLLDSNSDKKKVQII